MLVSGLQLISQTLDNGEWRARLKTACDFLADALTDETARRATLAVLPSITTDGYGLVNTSGVSDGELLEALGQILGKETEAAEIAALLPPPTQATLPPSVGVPDEDIEDVLQNQLEAFAGENRLLAAKVAAYEGNDALAASLLTGQEAEESEPAVGITEVVEEAERLRVDQT